MRWLTLLTLLFALAAEAGEERRFTAPVHWGERIHLSTPLVGTVAEDHCREGREVKAGEMVYRLDDEAWRAEAEAARAALQAARLELAEAQREMERVQALYDDGLIADQERRQAEIALARAQSRVGVAAAHQAEAALRLRQAQVQAPRDGRLIACLARRGEAVSGGLRPAVLAEMVVERSREVLVNLLETQPLALGAQVTVRARGKSYAGRVVRVDRSREDGAWRTWARVRFQPDEALPIGEKVEVSW